MTDFPKEDVENLHREISALLSAADPVTGMTVLLGMLCEGAVVLRMKEETIAEMVSRGIQAAYRNLGTDA